MADTRKKNDEQPTSVTRSRRERERLTRRQDILNVARQVFSEKSFHQATLEEIAERAEFAKGTIYGYFSSKEDLFENLISEELEFMENQIQEALSGKHNPKEKLHRYIEYLFKYFTQRKEFVKIYLSHIGRLVGQQPTGFQFIFAERHIRMIGFLVDFLVDSHKKGYFGKVPGIRGAYILQGIVHASVLGWLASGQSFDLMDNVDPLVDFILYGAGVPATD
jgi:TetR/AcrR family transcriptional regulator